jgi:hypothetical protein
VPGQRIAGAYAGGDVVCVASKRGKRLTTDLSDLSAKLLLELHC